METGSVTMSYLRAVLIACAVTVLGGCAMHNASVQMDQGDLAKAKQNSTIVAGVTLSAVSNVKLPIQIFESYWYPYDQTSGRLRTGGEVGTIGGAYYWADHGRSAPVYIVISVPPGHYVHGASLGVHEFAVRSITGYLTEGEFKNAGVSATRNINPGWEPANAKVDGRRSASFTVKAGDVVYLGDLHFVAGSPPQGGRYPVYSIAEVTQDFSVAQAELKKRFPSLAASLKPLALEWPE